MTKKDEESYARLLEEHEVILKGKRNAMPPVPGVMDVLQGMMEKLHDPEKGNEALHERTTSLEDRDKQRVAWVGGAKWVIGLLGGAIGYLIGLIFHH